MRFLFITIVFVFSFTASLYSQIELKATVKNENGKVLPYASIMVKDYANGTTSDIDGRFVLVLPDSLFNDTLIFSYVGYVRKSICVNDLTDCVSLESKIISLNEVIVSVDRGNKNKTIRIHKFRKRNCFIRFKQMSYGDSIFKPTRSKEPSIEAMYFPYTKDYKDCRKLKEIWIYMVSYSVPSYFGLHIYSVNTNNAPDNDLLNEPKIIRVDHSIGIVKIDLENENIWIPDDGIFVGVELLILPENKLMTDDLLAPIYSPFLGFSKSKKKEVYWIYSKGRWSYEDYISTSSYFIQRNKNDSPAISIIVSD